MDSEQIEISRGDPLERRADGLIHPTTCTDSPAGDWHEEILEEAGETTLEELQAKQPLRIGNVVVSNGGNLPCVQLVHLPVQTAPGVPTTPKNIQVALRSGLVAMDEPSVREVLIPRLTPTPEELSLEEVASTVLEDLLQYPPRHFQRVLLVDRDESWIQALRRAHPDEN